MFRRRPKVELLVGWIDELEGVLKLFESFWGFFDFRSWFLILIVFHLFILGYNPAVTLVNDPYLDRYNQQ